MALNKNEQIGVFIAVVVVFAFLFLSSGLFRASDSTSLDFDVPDDSLQSEDKSEDSGELVIVDLVEGSGELAYIGATLTVHYVGTLADGTQFDSSRDGGEPFQFIFGTGQVIQGWDQGLLGMKVGGTRTLTIPPELGYGSKNAGSIPANSTLFFEVELLGVDASTI